MSAEAKRSIFLFPKLKTNALFENTIPQDPKVPIVIYGDTEQFSQFTSSELVSELRKRNIPNRVVYYSPKKHISLNERTQFYDAGGDAIIDASDIGSAEEDPDQTAILVRQVSNLSKSELQRMNGKGVKEFGDGILIDASKKSFFINEVSIKLTAFQFKLLASFLELREKLKNNQYVPSEMLRQKIYDNGVKSSSILSANIHYLNKKLRPHGLMLSGDKRPSRLGYRMIVLNENAQGL